MKSILLGPALILILLGTLTAPPFVASIKAHQFGSIGFGLFAESPESQKESASVLIQSDGSEGSVGLLDSPPDIDWNVTYGGADRDEAYSVVQTADGGYLMAGSVFSLTTGLSNVWLVKVDSDGKAQWNKTYGGPDDDEARSVIQTSDGGYAIVGLYCSDYGNLESWLIKTDVLGNVQWDRKYGGLLNERADSVVQTTDGGYALAGYTGSYGAGAADFWLVKTDACGNAQWNRTYGGAHIDGASALVQTADEGYAIAGITDSFTNGDVDFWLVKTDSEGYAQWNQTYGGPLNDWARSMIETSDGGYAVAGETTPSGSPVGDAWLVRTDSAGTMLWNRTYGGSSADGAHSVVQSANGGFVLAGYTESYGAYEQEMWLVKTDSDGNALWNTTYGGPSSEWACCLTCTDEREYVIAGTTYSFGAGDMDFWLVKTPIRDSAIRNVAVTDVTPFSSIVSQNHNLQINVTAMNKGNWTDSFTVTAYANSTAFETKRVRGLPSMEQRNLTFVWNTIGFPEGEYVISAYAWPVTGETDTTDNACSDGTVKVLGPASFIIVAGNLNGDKIDTINNGCNKTCKILLELGYSGEDIYYMNQPEYYPQDVNEDGVNDTDAIASSAQLQWAIETWAATRVSPTRPLFLYLFDHGGEDQFVINVRPGSYDVLSSTDLATWLETLEAATNAPVGVIYAACHSGSFINELSKDGRVIATSSAADQTSWATPDLSWEIFSQPFWLAIQAGHSVGESFALAGKQLWLYCRGLQTPLLDDNGDGVGHTQPLPNEGDGLLAASLLISHCEWACPWTSYVVAKQYGTWPPPSSMTLWAKVENDSALLYVKAWMKPPDWVPPPPDAALPDGSFECFGMTDPDHDGNWTVDIPVANFTSHASGPSDFTFIITAKQENGKTSIPLVTGVEFTETGQPPADNMPPSIHIERPLEGTTIQDTIRINGTATDDVALEKAELYVDGYLIDTINLPPTSNTFFEFTLDTMTIANGPRTVQVKTFDTSSNVGIHTLTAVVNNFVHDVTVTHVRPVKTLVGQGYVLRTNVTLANHGSYPETFNVTMYCNDTAVTLPSGKQYILVTLPTQSYAIVAFSWSTIGFDRGSYDVKAYAWPVVGETDLLDDTTYSEKHVRVTIPGNVDGDQDVDILDVVRITGIYASRQGDAIFNLYSDINDDGQITILDVVICTSHYGQKWP